MSTPGYCPVNAALKGLHERTYRNSDNVAFSNLRSTDEYGTKQRADCANQREQAQEELYPSRDLDPNLDLVAHRLRIGRAVRHNHVAVWVLVEIDQRAVGRRLRGRWRAVARLCHGLGVEVAGLIVHRLPLRGGEVGLPAAHGGD